MEDLHTKKCIDQNKNMNFKSKAHLANSRMEDEYQRIDHNLKKQELKFAVESVFIIIHLGTKYHKGLIQTNSS